MREIKVHSLEETEALAHKMAAEIAAPRVILLEGTLGMGKSSYARAFIRALTGNANQEVPSPTFTLVQSYDSAKGEIWHMDLYRLEDPDEIWELDWEDASSSHICLVEWPDRLGPYRPKDAMNITITQGALENERLFTITD